MKCFASAFIYSIFSEDNVYKAATKLSYEVVTWISFKLSPLIMDLILLSTSHYSSVVMNKHVLQITVSPSPSTTGDL